MKRKKITVEITRLPSNTEIEIPSYQSTGAAGMDVRACCSSPVVIQPGERTLVPTGFAVAIPEGYEVQLRPRSGLASRHGITLPNSPATIDSDFRGEILVPLINLSREAFTIEPGMRIAQLLIFPVFRIEWHEVPELPKTLRGSGGFGYTGI